jgi:AcrR family transcriptional regulator
MRVTAATRLATRERILEASQGLFATQGFESATTREIARAAGIGVGTLFNYFPTKEAIAQSLIGEACEIAAEKFKAQRAGADAEPLSFEEELFAHVADLLRKLKPFRKYLTTALDQQLSPLVQHNGDAPSLRATHLEVVDQIAARHGVSEALQARALQIYWTLLVGVLLFWAQDASPKQEDTLALLDESLAMFCGWLASHSNSAKPSDKRG